MAYEIRWLQSRDGGHMQQTHTFDSLDDAKEFAQGLGVMAHAEIFDDAPHPAGTDQKPVWSADTPQADEKERNAARAAAVVGKSEGLGPNAKSDTRGDKPEDVRAATAGTVGSSAKDRAQALPDSALPKGGSTGPVGTAGTAGSSSDSHSHTPTIGATASRGSTSSGTK